jgi:beta-xylosidase
MVKEWPEVFEDLYMNTMPLAYLEVINLEFANGRVWQINVREQMTNSNLDRMSDKLLDILQEYKKDIIKIDFRINVLRLKEDIAKLTSSIL